MIPLAGSAYTYAYATLGELFAWIIGWDLTLEYAMGASTVSSGCRTTLSSSCRSLGSVFPLAGLRSLDRLRTALERVTRASLLLIILSCTRAPAHSAKRLPR